jgi:hypothetical protein
MQIASEPTVVGTRSDLRIGPDEQGLVRIVVVHDDRRIVIALTPEEAEAHGLMSIKAATVAHLKQRQAAVENADPRLEVHGP